jgi:hypothetical protein
MNSFAIPFGVNTVAAPQLRNHLCMLPKARRLALGLTLTAALQLVAGCRQGVNYLGQTRWAVHIGWRRLKTIVPGCSLPPTSNF